MSAPDPPEPTAPPRSRAAGSAGRQRYELLRELGRGGMGAVYEARDRVLDRRVALKLLHDSDAGARQRFLREARIAAGLSHPGIVRVHEVGPDYIAMALVEGRTLEQMRGAGLEPQQELELLEQVAEAVGHAHRQGVVHRDLKPGNVLIDAAGRAVVVDFGLARNRESTRLTGAGQVMGTVRYMSPEQVLGQDRRIDARADVWALGVMLFEMLAGAPPFSGATAAELFEQILEQRPVLPPRAPGPLAEICRVALAKSPEDRYLDGAALALALRCHREGRSPVRPRRVRAALLLGAALAFSAAIGLRAPRAARPAALPSATPPLRRPAPLQRYTRAIEQTRRAAYVAGIDWAARRRALERELEALERLALVEPERAALWGLLGRGWYVAGGTRRAEQALLRARALAPGDPSVSGTLAQLYLELACASLVVRDGLVTPAGQRRTGELADRAAAFLRDARGPWAESVSITGQLYRVLKSFAVDPPERVIGLCRAGCARHGQELGSELFWLLQGILLEGRQSLEAYARALARRPHYALCRMLVGMEWGLQGRPERAIEHLDRAVRLDPRLAEAWHARAVYRIRLGRVAEARRDLDQALRLEPGWAIGYQNRGLLRSTVGDLPGALADLQHALRLHPHQPLAWHGLGQVRQAMGQVRLALEAYDRAIELDRGRVELYHSRARLRYGSGDREGGIADYRASLALRPGDYRTWCVLAECLSQTGHPRQALAALGRARRAAPAGLRPLLDEQIRALRGR